MPTHLRLVPKQPEVIRIRRRKPAAVRRLEPEFGTFEALKTPEDWRRFSQRIFGDDRLAPADEPPRAAELVRDGNVIQLPLPRRRSTAAEIEAVRLSEERRGKRR